MLGTKREMSLKYMKFYILYNNNKKKKIQTLVHQMTTYGQDHLVV